MNDAALAARLLAHDPGLGGMVVRGAADAVLAMMGETVTLRRCPAHIDRERLNGGLDLAATLAAGRPVMATGLLDAAAGGAVVVPLAERIEADIAGALAAALDAGTVRAVLLDSSTDGEGVPAALLERVAFIVDGDADEATATRAGSPQHVAVTDAHLHAIAAASAALGVGSPRAALFTLRAAKGLAACAGRSMVADDDIVTAIRLVLVPRATQWPEATEEAAPPPDSHDRGEGAGEADGPLADTVLDAVRATLPPGLLDAIAARLTRGRAKARGSGARKRSPTRGRPVGVKAGLPRGGARLALLDTLRAAAPWQRLRGATDRIAIRRSDLRIRRFRSRSQTVTIFAVDASGSAAAARMAEAKGAVELLLTQAYAKRAQVALIAFRGEDAALILPPTRSLTRARRLLAALPGGGGTPIAAGLDMARTLALAERAKEHQPHIIILTDGRANVPSDGTGQRGAEAAARAIADDGIAATLIDIAARPRPEGRSLAEAMAARYIALPRADAAALSAAIR